MAIVTRNRQPFGEGGAAIVYLGEAVTVAFRLLSSASVVQDYTGRAFGLRVYSDGGTTVLNVSGSIVDHADGDYVACVLPGTSTDDLTVGRYGWEFCEFVSGGRVVILTGSFQVAAGSSAAQASGDPGTISGPITLYEVLNETITEVLYMGSPGSGGAWGSITGTLSAQTDLQAALNAKQASDADLTAIAGLSPSNDDLLQRKAGAWTNRTIAQVKTDLALTKSDVGLGNADNTSDANKPISTAAQTALDAKQPLDSDLTTIGGLTPSNDDILQRKAGAWANRTPAQLKTDLALVKGDVGLGNVDNTSDANKPISTATQTALDAKQALDADLTAIAALTPSARQVLQYVGGVWTAQFPLETWSVAISDETTAITTGTAKATLHIPYAFKVTAVYAGLSTAGSSSTVIDINEGGTSILSTKITLDSSIKFSTGSATQPVISDADIAAGGEVSIDIDTAGAGAKGAKVYIVGYRNG